MVQSTPGLSYRAISSVKLQSTIERYLGNLMEKDLIEHGLS